MRETVRGGLLVCGLVLAAGALAQEGTQSSPSPEEAAMMKAWNEARTPGAPHQHLAESAGTWNFTTKMWMDPSGAPMVSTGTATRDMLLGGRVLRERVESTMMGEPFQGLGLTGYDNVTGKYWSTWADNMGTGMMVSEGSYDPATHTMTFSSEVADPLTKKMIKVRMVGDHSAPDHEVFKFYEIRADGGEKMTMEITYDRAK
jgi:hypothetical protein